MVAVSRWIATLSYLVLVPGSIALAYLGYRRGLYGYLAVPIAFGVIVAVALGALLLVLPRIRRIERSR